MAVQKTPLALVTLVAAVAILPAAHAQEADKDPGGTVAMAAPPEPTPAPPDEAAGADIALPTVDELLDRMEAARRKLKTFKAKVVKLRQVEVFGDERFEGEMQFKMPRFLRMRLAQVFEKEPQRKGEETFVIVGRKYAWKYYPARRQVHYGRLRDLEERTGQANPLEYGLARDLHELRSAYELTVQPFEVIQGAKSVPLRLTPVGGDDYASGTLIFWVDVKTWLPQQIREYKSNGEVVETHAFSEIKLNEKTSDNLFEFEIPEGVDEFPYTE